MSSSKKKYSFHRKKSENNQYININRPIFTNESDIVNKDSTHTILNQQISVDNLISSNNINEKLKKENVSSNPIIISKNNEKEEINNLTNNPDLQYLINQNETENIDFINTLLKLKGISIDNSKGYKSSKNITLNKNFDEEKILVPKSSKNNNFVINNYYKYNKSIPTTDSTSTSKINTINCNYHHNENEEEENLKNLETFTFSTNEMNNNMDNSNINNRNNSKNSLLKELLMDNNNEKAKEKDNLKDNKINNNKETIMSSELNSNNFEEIHVTKDNSISKEHYINIKYPKNINDKNIIKIFKDKSSDLNKKVKNRAIIPINKDNNRLFIKKNINENINKQKKDIVKNEQLNNSSESRILKKKSINRIPHNKKILISNLSNYNINENNNIISDKNNSKRKNSKSKKKSINKCMIKNEQKVNNTEIYKTYKNKSKNKEDLIKHQNNVFKIKKEPQSKEHLQNINKSYNVEIKHESNISEKQYKEIDLHICNNNENSKNKSNKKGKINNIIKLKSQKDNLNIDKPFNSERKTTKIFKIKDNMKLKTEISPNRSNNISYINSRNENNKNIHKYKLFNNLNSYAKIAKNKNFISPSLKNKNRRYINNLNKINYEEVFNKNNADSHYNFSFNNYNISDNISVNDINKNRIIFKNENINNEKEEFNRTIDMNNEDFNDDGIKEKKINDNKQNDINENIVKNKNKTSKFAEIFLFETNEENAKKEKKEEKKFNVNDDD